VEFGIAANACVIEKDHILAAKTLMVKDMIFV
jgi:hypothetical protein